MLFVELLRPAFAVVLIGLRDPITARVGRARVVRESLPSIIPNSCAVSTGSDLLRNTPDRVENLKATDLTLPELWLYETALDLGAGEALVMLALLDFVVGVMAGSGNTVFFSGQPGGQTIWLINTLLVQSPQRGRCRPGDVPAHDHLDGKRLSSLPVIVGIRDVDNVVMDHIAELLEPPCAELSQHLSLRMVPSTQSNADLGPSCTAPGDHHRVHVTDLTLNLGSQAIQLDRLKGMRNRTSISSIGIMQHHQSLFVSVLRGPVPSMARRLHNHRTSYRRESRIRSSLQRFLEFRRETIDQQVTLAGLHGCPGRGGLQAPRAAPVGRLLA